VFFVLSGMVILRSLEGFGYDRKRFLLVRAARIMPAFLVVFAAAVAVQPLPTALPWMPWVAADEPGRAVWSTGWPARWAEEIGAHLTMTHGLFPDGVLPGAWISFLGAAWSLSTEAQFYAVVALLAPLLRKRGGLVRLFLALSAAALVWKWAAPDAWRFSRVFLPNKAQYFALGIASADWIADARPRAAARFATVLCASLALSALWRRGGQNGRPGRLDRLPPRAAWRRIAVACGSAAVATFAAARGDVVLRVSCKRAGAEAAVNRLCMGGRMQL
jgi:peptidoglycan/LPS O-acetylase OafA/YrhL